MEKDFFTIELPEQKTTSIEEFSRAQKTKKNKTKAKSKKKKKTVVISSDNDEKREKKLSKDDDFEEILRENGIDSYEMEDDKRKNNSSREENDSKRTRKKKKKTRARRIAHIRLGLIFGSIIAVAILIALVILLCEVKDVVVEKNTIVSDDVVISHALDDKFCKNAVYVVLKNNIKPHEDIPFCSSIKVSLKNRNTVRIVVKERYPAGYYITKSKKYAYFNDDGIVTDVSKQFVESVFLTNTITNKTVKGKEIPLADGQSETVAMICKLTDKYDIKIDSIDIKDDSSIYIASDGILIALGTRTNLEEKIKRLPYILPHLENMQGTLHLENWTSENTDIVFRQAQ